MDIVTLQGVIIVPSRFARLVEGYYAFVYRCKKEYWERVICPALHNTSGTTLTAYNTILAPTTHQRLSWASSYLHVFSKLVVKVFKRHAKLIDVYKVSLV